MKKIFKWIGIIVVGLWLIGTISENKESNSSSSSSSRRERDQMHKAAVHNVVLAAYDWSKNGFGNIMMLDFVIRNDNDYPVKDIKIKCNHFAPSQTLIDSNTSILYEIIEPKKARRFKDFNMGFIHSQVKSTVCEIIDAVEIK